MSMMRVTPELVEDLKLLKGVKSAKGKLGTHSDLVHNLVKAELRKTHAETNDGYLAEGSVVLGPSGKPIVIGRVSKSEVVFTDGTFVINGSVACCSMTLLSDSVENFDGGLFDV